MKIQNKLMALALSIGMGFGAIGASTATAASNCCYDLCYRDGGGSVHPKMMERCLAECRDTSNGYCYLP